MDRNHTQRMVHLGYSSSAANDGVDEGESTAPEGTSAGKCAVTDHN